VRFCTRTPEPDVLARLARESTEAYVERRRSNPAARWQWPRRDGLYEVVVAALRAMTVAHCSYCDGHPIDSVGEEQVDHFRPKSEFHHLVCAWTNLFLTCNACNRAKREQWDEALLKPDDAAYRFDDYFSYNFERHELEPNPFGSDEHRRRAAVTITILDLNRAGACVARKRAFAMIKQAASADRHHYGYRFLADFLDDVRR
jgi:uncharacterized protein (TIGR02646 family)